MKANLDEHLRQIDTASVDYLEILQSESGDPVSIFESRRPSRLFCLAMLLSDTFYHRLQAWLLLGGDPAFLGITRAFLAAMLALTELSMWYAVNAFERRRGRLDRPDRIFGNCHGNSLKQIQ